MYLFIKTGLVFLQIKEEASDEESDTLSTLSVNVDFDKLDRKQFNKEFVFVTEDGKTAECFEEIGKLFLIQVFRKKSKKLSAEIRKT